MGPLEQILGMLPGMGNLKELAANRDAGRREAAGARRGDHQLDDAEGAAQSPVDQRQPPEADRQGERHVGRRVNRLLKQFVQMKKMLKQLGGMAGLGKKRGGLGMMKSLMKDQRQTVRRPVMVESAES